MFYKIFITITVLLSVLFSQRFLLNFAAADNTGEQSKVKCFLLPFHADRDLRCEYNSEDNIGEETLINTYLYGEDCRKLVSCNDNCQLVEAPNYKKCVDCRRICNYPIGIDCVVNCEKNTGA